MTSAKINTYIFNVTTHFHMSCGSMYLFNFVKACYDTPKIATSLVSMYM